MMNNSSPEELYTLNQERRELNLEYKIQLILRVHTHLESKYTIKLFTIMLTKLSNAYLFHLFVTQVVRSLFKTKALCRCEMAAEMDDFYARKCLKQKWKNNKTIKRIILIISENVA